MSRPEPSQHLIEERFWSKVTKTDTCWLWSAGIHRSGYGVFSVKHKQIYAHRYSYILHHGAIPDGLVLDHTCHGEDAACVSGDLCPHRRCVRPEHLEAVPFSVNVRRGNAPAAKNVLKTHCPAGHPYDEANTVRTPGGSRVCRECKNQVRRNRRARKAASA